MSENQVGMTTRHQIESKMGKHKMVKKGLGKNCEKERLPLVPRRPSKNKVDIETIETIIKNWIGSIKPVKLKERRVVDIEPTPPSLTFQALSKDELVKEALLHPNILHEPEHKDLSSFLRNIGINHIDLIRSASLTRRVFRKYQFMVHPDKNKGLNNEDFERVYKTFTILSNRKLKNLFDEKVKRRKE